VKDIQTRFSDFPALLAAFPSGFAQDSGSQRAKRVSFSPRRKGRDYSGGSVPDFPAYARSRGSLYLDITYSNDSHLTNFKNSVKFFSIDCIRKVKTSPSLSPQSPLNRKLR
jgi:hypothetical protein